MKKCLFIYSTFKSGHLEVAFKTYLPSEIKEGRRVFCLQEARHILS